VLEPTNLAGFRRDPHGRYVTGDRWLYFCAPTGHLWGTVYWGELVADDFRRLDAVVDVSTDPRFAPHVTLVDARRVTGIEAAAFASLKEHVESRKAALARSVERLALVRPAGLAGAVAEGFFRIAEAPYPVRTFEAPREALEWLGLPDEAALAKELDVLQATAVGIDPFVRDLRALMESSPASLTLAAAATALGFSLRTFQRRLRDNDVRFKNELAQARIRVAKRRLVDPNTRLTTLALELGFASPAHFSNCFRRLTGLAPSAWRERMREG
jgi:AraC-like DNA-binding protein